MSSNMKPELKQDHISGNFEWDKELTCRCGRAAQAVQDRFLFVSNVVDGSPNEDKSNQFYMMPIDADGNLVKRKGVSISNCPWCGDKLKGYKKYSK